MPTAPGNVMTPDQFIKKWKPVQLTERSAAQQHFIDLCYLLGEPTPAEADPTGDTYTFEKGASKASGGNGWADVWRRGVFGWEYKGKGKDLDAAYLQLKLYADALENPPLLVTSDIQRIVVHTNFTNTVKKVHTIELEDLADPKKVEMLRWVFAEPEKLRPGLTRAMVTTAAAEKFSAIAHLLQSKGHPPQKVAHFLNRLIFCMFAEDVGLLPNNVFNRMVSASAEHPESFESYARQLFQSMSKGGSAGWEKIDWFNGGLFDSDETLPLEKPEIELLLKCADLDWTFIEPSIFGTLFERGLDPDKRSQQGAHYTDPATIAKIVRPVVLEPWDRRWSSEKKHLERLLGNAKTKVSDAAVKRFSSFLEDLYQYRVLDPACGSGNFLYIALRTLKDFEKRVILEAEALGLPKQFPRIGPESVLGMEVNAYAAELARVTVWIGEIQWMLENGFGVAKDPILKPLTQIECRDALLNDDGTAAAWPKADAIVGNPPFLGSQLLLRGLGDEYATRLRSTYEGDLTAGADLCAYWFVKAARMVEQTKMTRVGLVATQSIRKGKNRQALEAVTGSGKIFSAWADEPWINEGAAVRVSIVCFGPKHDLDVARLDGKAVERILPDLTAGQPSGGVDLTLVRPLKENRGVAFQGTLKVGAFDVTGEIARAWLTAPLNPNGRPNSDVVRPWLNGQDVTKRPSDTWIIDFGTDRTERDAAFYEAPFNHLLNAVKSVRMDVREKKASARWWIHQRARPEMRKGLKGLQRCIATSRVSKHRLFVWMDTAVLPDSRLYVVAREDDATFGILHSRIHEIWALANASMHGVGNDPTYSAGTCFEAFPFPAGMTLDRTAADPSSDERVQRIAVAAKLLDQARAAWLNPPDLVDVVTEVVEGFPDRHVPKNADAASTLKKRTLTLLYNAKPAWLQQLHRDLDEAVAAAYGWEWPLQDDEVLKRLFALNQERSVRDIDGAEANAKQPEVA